MGNFSELTTDNWQLYGRSIWRTIFGNDR